MGAIASSNSARRLALFRQVMLASAAIPVLFPPVYIHVEAGGKAYDEMHVDGATANHVILYGNTISAQAIKRGVNPPLPRPPRVYVIVNNKLTAEPQRAEPSLMGIALNAISVLTQSQRSGNLHINAVTQRDVIDFNLACIPSDFSAPSGQDYSPAFLNSSSEYRKCPTQRPEGAHAWPLRS